MPRVKKMKPTKMWAVVPVRGCIPLNYIRRQKPGPVEGCRFARVLVTEIVKPRKRRKA